MLWRRIVAVEVCINRNETFILNPSLPKLNRRPGHTQQRKVQLRHEYPSHVSGSDTLECRSAVFLNNDGNPAQAVALPRISELISHIVSCELINRVDCVDCRMGLEITP